MKDTQEVTNCHTTPIALQLGRAGKDTQEVTNCNLMPIASQLGQAEEDTTTMMAETGTNRPNILPPLQALKAKQREEDGGWFLEVDKAEVRRVEEGLLSHKMSMTDYLQSLVDEGRDVYRAGSEFCLNAAEVFADVQSVDERKAMVEILSGVRMKWKEGAERRQLETWAERARAAAKKGRPPMGPRETKAFCEKHVDDATARRARAPRR